MEARRPSPFVAAAHLEHRADQGDDVAERFGCRLVPGTVGGPLGQDRAGDATAHRKGHGENRAGAVAAGQGRMAAGEQDGVGRLRVDHRAVLLHGLVHGLADVPVEARPPVEGGAVRDRLDPHPAAVKKTDADPIAVEPGGQFGGHLGGRVLQPVMFQAGGDQLDDGDQLVLAGRGPLRVQGGEPGGRVLDPAERGLLAGGHARGQAQHHRAAAGLRLRQGTGEQVKELAAALRPFLHEPGPVLAQGRLGERGELRPDRVRIRPKGDGGKVVSAPGRGEHGAAGHSVDQAAEREQPVLGELILQTDSGSCVVQVVSVPPGRDPPAIQKRPRVRKPRSA